MDYTRDQGTVTKARRAESRENKPTLSEYESGNNFATDECYLPFGILIVSTRLI